MNRIFALGMITPFSLAICMSNSIAANAETIPLQEQTKAIARILNIKGDQVGTATFSPTKMGVRVKLEVQNLTVGEHMVHIHEFGKCDAPDYLSSGNHFDPQRSPDAQDDMHHDMHQKHGKKPMSHKPAGDLPNIVVKANGRGSLTTVLEGLTLGSANNSLLKQGGTSILIHAGANGKSTIANVDYKTRIACGVIVRQ